MHRINIHKHVIMQFLSIDVPAGGGGGGVQISPLRPTIWCVHDKLMYHGNSTHMGCVLRLFVDADTVHVASYYTVLS